jgi:signal transduction histidine kinase
LLANNTIRTDGNRATMKMMGINPFTLSFGKEYEVSFKKKYFLDSLLQFRVAFFLVMFLYGLFIILDKRIVTDYYQQFFAIRFYFVLPFLLFVFIFSFTPWFERFWQRLLTISFIIAGTGIAIMTITVPSNYAYYAGTMLIFSAGYFFIKLRFFYASIAGWGTLIIFNVLSVVTPEVTTNTLITINFFYVSANIIGMVAAYYIEFYTRRDFYLQRQLESERKKVMDANRLLEHKVNERTQQIRQKNKELILAKNKAEYSDRMKSKFLGNVSHEIRTPLNAISGYSQLILMEPESPDEVTENAQVVLLNSQKLERMIDLLIEISDIESGAVSIKYENINLNQLIKNVIAEFEGDFIHGQKHIEIKTSFDLPDNKEISTIEKNRIRQLYENLFENSLKFTRQGHIEIGYSVKNRKIECFVKDTGEGIPIELQERIFDRAMQFAGKETHNEKGAGLGLRFCKLIVNLYHGEIWFNSKKDVGTNFFFTIPFNPEAI